MNHLKLYTIRIHIKKNNVFFILIYMLNIDHSSGSNTPNASSKSIDSFNYVVNAE